MRESKKYLFWILILYFLVRIPIMLSNSDARPDDFKNGYLALEFLRGLRLPLFDYQSDPYGGGSLAEAFWIAPFFGIFGTSLFVLRIPIFTLHVLSLIAWYFVFIGHFSPKQTFFMLLFLVLPPPEITSFMLQTDGHHFPMILWVPISLLIFRRFLDGKLSELKAGLYLGLLGGVTTWLILTNAVTAAVLLIYLALVQKKEIHKKLFYTIYTLFFLIGFSPWLFYNWERGWGGVAWIFYMFSPGNIVFSFGKNLVQLFLLPEWGLQGLFGFPILPKAIGIVFTIIYLTLIVIAFVDLWRRNRIFWKSLEGRLNIEVFGLIFSVFLTVLVAAERFGVYKYYHLFPITPFIGMALVNLAQKNRWLQKRMAVFCIGAGIIGNLGLVDFGGFGKPLRLQGYSLSQWVMGFEMNFASEKSLYSKQGGLKTFQEKLKIIVKDRPFSERKIIYQALSWPYFELKNTEDLKNILSFIEDVDGAFKPIFFEKLGEHLGPDTEWNHQKIQALLEQSGIAEGFQSAVYRGVIQGFNRMDWSLRKKVETASPFCHKAAASSKPGCYEGIGLLTDTTDWAAGKVKHHNWILSQLDQAYLFHYLKGVGRDMVPDMEQISRMLAVLNRSEKDWFLKGVTAVIMDEEDPWKREELLKKISQ